MHLGHNHAGLGHNGGASTKQWQTPHLPEAHHHPLEEKGEPDLDLVETAFALAFPQAPDPTSFLRLAGVPFIGETAGGRRFSLLRVELNMTTDIGSLTPHLGGASHRYDPLPAPMVSRRQRLLFIYFDGAGTLPLTLAEAKTLKNVTPDR
ncbi:hypothetical protein BH10PSE9_BH10PSE9_11170 [soil metagenome]